jgi:NADH-quinone oxidoreductase subunit J
MGITALAFYLFAIVAVASGLLVVLARNPVHSVLWLILTFFSAAGMFVYVGAVAVLFLFVVMMLDVDFTELKGGMAKYLPVGVLIGAILLLELGLVFSHWTFAEEAQDLRQSVTPDMMETHNTAALGQLIYTDYIYLFQAAGLILLVAMIGAIVLTLRHRPNIKRQNIPYQILRDPAEAMELKDVKPGQGL